MWVACTVNITLASFRGPLSRIMMRVDCFKHALSSLFWWVVLVTKRLGKASTPIGVYFSVLSLMYQILQCCPCKTGRISTQVQVDIS